MHKSFSIGGGDGVADAIIAKRHRKSSVGVGAFDRVAAGDARHAGLLHPIVAPADLGNSDYQPNAQFLVNDAFT